MATQRSIQIISTKKIEMLIGYRKKIFDMKN